MSGFWAVPWCCTPGLWAPFGALWGHRAIKGFIRAMLGCPSKTQDPMTVGLPFLRTNCSLQKCAPILWFMGFFGVCCNERISGP